MEGIMANQSCGQIFATLASSLRAKNPAVELKVKGVKETISLQPTAVDGTTLYGKEPILKIVRGKMRKTGEHNRKIPLSSIRQVIQA